MSDEEHGVLRDEVIRVAVAQIRATPKEILNRLWSDYAIEGSISRGVEKHPEVIAAFEEVAAKLAPALAERVRKLADKAKKAIEKKLSDAFRY